MKTPSLALALAIGLCSAAPHAAAQAPEVPDWALPGSATHHQVPPPAGFSRASRTSELPIGIFDGQSDVGGAVVTGSSTFSPANSAYTINSAGYNIWYFRDEFRFLWKKVSGDVSLAADVAYPVAGGYGDRKAVLIVRQDLDDDSREAMVALHGAGLIHLAERPTKGADIKEDHRIEGHAGQLARRIGIEKRGDKFALYVSMSGEPMHQVGPLMDLHLDGPFYVGIGFCSHLPATADTAVLSNVTFDNEAGKVR